MVVRINVFYNSLKLIENYKNKEIDLDLKAILKEYYDEYRNYIHKCKFRCYKCDYCEKVLEKANQVKFNFNLRR
jgi:hypothetical protein